ncbi:PH domain-containing protein [Nocardiopsis sp. NRRL B-16309]|uniref:PH domain-containing protein n=1 Tax=Nocardiopsis sp. NRRL B-16309 TaxID=1519494 RepID=UPI0006AFBC05|nr:PH domain-containing protein [Nocardiopsis sp. NRRL B-16309]KOX20824.1 bacterial PH domain protein [Nocardiopsis sp. NRRL B-16309]
MAIADRYLSDDEELVHVARQHWTVLAGEFVALALIVAVVGAALWFLPWDQDWSLIAMAVVVGLGLVAALLFWLVPMLKWSTTVFILTNRRLMMRDGIISKQGRDMPLTRVNDVSFDISLWERLMRYGTLSVQSASEQEGMVLRRVPRPQWFQSEIYRQVNAVHMAQRPGVPPDYQG